MTRRCQQNFAKIYVWRLQIHAVALPYISRSTDCYYAVITQSVNLEIFGRATAWI